MTYNATIPDSHSVRTLSLPGVQDGFTDLHDLARWSHLCKTERGYVPNYTIGSVWKHCSSQDLTPTLYSCGGSEPKMHVRTVTIPKAIATWARKPLQHQETTTQRGTGVGSILKSCTWNYCIKIS